MQQASFETSWRYKLGLFLIILGHTIFLLAVILPFSGYASIPIAGILFVIGEITTLSSIVVLGLNGFKVIKSKIVRYVKDSYQGEVGKCRHYLGISIFLLNLLTTYLTVIYAWLAFHRPTPQNPMPIIWGLDFDSQGTMVLCLFLIGELSILVALYLLGGAWWERFRRLIIWDGE